MPSFNITSAGISAVEDREKRIRVYFIMMTIRLACVTSLIWVRGWWVLLVAFGAVFLPYIAVLLANEPDHRANKQVESPEKRQLTSSTESTAAETTEPVTIIFDADEEYDAR